MQPVCKASTSRSGASSGPDADSGNPMQLVGILLEALDNHMCDRLNSIERQLAGLGLRIDKGFSMDNMQRRPLQTIDIDVTTTDMVAPVINPELQSKNGEPDALLVYLGSDVEFQYMQSGGFDQDKKMTEEGEVRIMSVSEKPPNSPEKEAKRGAPTKDERTTPHKVEMVDALHNAMGHNSKHAHSEWHHDNRWQDITNSVPFNVLSISSIVVNGFLAGLEADYTLRYLLGHTRFKEGTLDTDVQDINYIYFRMADYIVFTWWILELLFYILAQGRKFFRMANPSFSWNMFDVACVTVTSVEIMADLAGEAIPDMLSQGYLRLLRIFRVIRVLRVSKVVRFLQGARKLIIAVQGALLTLFWALVLLALFVYVYAVMMSTVVTQYYSNLDINLSSLTAADKLRTEDMDAYYGGVLLIMSTLFEAITGGDWIATSAPLYEISWAGRILWFSYISFTIFGLLNVFTGIFVESATKAANSDHEIVMEQEKQDENSCVSHIRLLFETHGLDDGHITGTMLQDLLLDEQFKMQLSALGLHTTEADGLFKLLDGDCSGSVSIEEFISGCLRLKGAAQAVDMVTMLYETNKLSRKLSRLEKALDKALGLHLVDEDGAGAMEADQANAG